MTITKRSQFKFVTLRRRQLKPRWHTFNCLDCGALVQEFSDPRASMYLCENCIHARTGRGLANVKVPEQRQTGIDWWTLWCLEYESKKSCGLI